MTCGRAEAIRELSVVGQEQQSFACIVQPSNRIDALAEILEVVHHRVAALGSFTVVTTFFGL